MASLTIEGAKMGFTALFLSVVVVVAVSWWGSRQLALALFTVALIASVATYFYHATDVLTLSF
jgi:ABC-type proline/glycine betaine transport system permease subunit